VLQCGVLLGCYAILSAIMLSDIKQIVVLLSVTILSVARVLRYTWCHYIMNGIYQSVDLLSIIMLSVVMLSVNLLNVVAPN
jgi:hypothetical protein